MSDEDNKNPEEMTTGRPTGWTAPTPSTERPERRGTGVGPGGETNPGAKPDPYP